MSKTHETLSTSRLASRACGAFAILVAASVLAACAADETEYKPQFAGKSVGYTDRQLAADRYLISFSGSGASTQGDVESHLLRRAAEITLQRGYTHFIVDTQNTERNTYRVPGFISDTYLHGPMYAYRVRFWSDYPEYWEGKETRYSAEAEIVMRLPYEVAGNPRAVEAASVFRVPGPPPVLPILAQDTGR
jgi:hypothetical protein